MKSAVNDDLLARRQTGPNWSDVPIGGRSKLHWCEYKHARRLLNVDMIAIVLT
jgi:hypothetical protein